MVTRLITRREERHFILHMCPAPALVYCNLSYFPSGILHFMYGFLLQDMGFISQNNVVAPRDVSGDLVAGKYSDRAKKSCRVNDMEVTCLLGYLAVSRFRLKI
ncbi:hypothetical protein CEXT_729231 [Caerostris extrusa]|uniref:Uncharacterized protein n=1 Tax=Caerostris extrusa TaxID=172846 RepID=A0AAV4Y2S2_CAEEX|nr:hypothetical protein CEXT_729231 [Caerostris extrusa]